MFKFLAPLALVFMVQSSFANDCTVYFEAYDREMQCQGCGDGFYKRFDKRVRKALQSRGYTVVTDANDARFTLDRTSTKFHEAQWGELFSRTIVDMKMVDRETANTYQTQYEEPYLLQSEESAENKAAARATKLLPKCGEITNR